MLNAYQKPSSVLGVTLNLSHFIELVYALRGTYKIQYHPNGRDDDTVYEVNFTFLTIFLLYMMKLMLSVSLGSN